MLRVHFSTGDLARTRVADGPDPLWETVLSLHRLQERRNGTEFADWRRRVAQTETGPLRLLLPLVPRRGYFPDFLTPPGGCEGLERGLDALMSTRRRQLRADLLRLGDSSPLPRWARSLADGETPTLRRLSLALRSYHHAAVAPSWRWISARVEGDRTHRCHAQWRGGTEAMLRTFDRAESAGGAEVADGAGASRHTGVGIRWRAPVLEVDYPKDADIRLEGRGLLLVPSYFCRGTPVALADPALPPTLVYPAGRGTPGRGCPLEAASTRHHLAQLLGHTRAAVLQSLGGDCSTSELAARAGVSLSSASEHAAVLRRAGLISSVRRSNRVHHALTSTGLTLLEGGSAQMAA